MITIDLDRNEGPTMSGASKRITDLMEPPVHLILRTRSSCPPIVRVRCVALALLLAAGAGTANERELGDQLSWALPIGTAAVELWRGDLQGVWQLTQTFVLTTGSTELLKKHTGVTRPDGSNDQSFPSGHAARAYSAAAYVQQRHGFAAAWPLWLGATYVGHTRVQARRHRWSEVAVAGALAYGFASWRVEPLPARGQAWLGPDGQGGWQAGLALPF
jgi:membrane-associated phospholipid phosphatase